jgi:predicted  nucleic acid-binding Zn-ribbon protein
MGHCIGCGAELLEVVESDTDTRYNGDGTVWECPECGAVLGVSEIGV